MFAFSLDRRAVPAGAAAVTGPPRLAGHAKAESCRAFRTPGFGKAADGAGHPAVHRVGSAGTVTAVHRSDDEAKTRARIDDDHRGGRTGETVPGDPRVSGRFRLAANGRGIQYGEPV